MLSVFYNKQGVALITVPFSIMALKTKKTILIVDDNAELLIGLKLILGKYFSENSFEALKYPLTIAATNILKAEITYFNSGPLIKPIIASAALPPLFSPIEINGQLYSDGGILDNFPLDSIKNNCDKLIGSFVNPVTEIEKSKINSTTDLVYRIYHIGMDVDDIEKFKDCNYVFSPPNLDDVGSIDTKSIRKAYKLGYEFAQEEISNILKSIE